MDTVNKSSKARVDEKLVDILFQNTPLLHSVALINATLVYFVMDEYVSGFVLISWLFIMLILTVQRLFVVNRYWNYRRNGQDCNVWLNLYLLTVYISGIVWGSLIFIPGPNIEIWMEAFIAFVFASMSTTALITLSPLAKAAVPYFLLILGSLFFQIAYPYAELPQIAMMVMIAFYVIMLIRVGYRIQSTLIRAIKVEIENEDLYDFLKIAKQNTERTREKLQQQISVLPEQVQEREYFFDNTRDYHCVLAEDGSIRQLNRTLRKLLGLDRNDDMHGLFERFVANQDVAHFQDLLTVARRDNHLFSRQVLLQSSNGRTCAVNLDIICTQGRFFLKGRPIDVNQ